MMFKHHDLELSELELNKPLFFIKLPSLVYFLRIKKKKSGLRVAGVGR